MKLSVVERITLSGMLPEKGSYTNLKLVRVARESLSFTDEEHKLLKFRTEEISGRQRSFWDQNRLIDKTTNKVVEGDQEYVTNLVTAKPNDYEMRPTVGEIDIKLGEIVTNMVIKMLKDLEETENLENQHFTLYEKFCVRDHLKIVGA